MTTFLRNLRSHTHTNTQRQTRTRIHAHAYTDSHIYICLRTHTPEHTDTSLSFGAYNDDFFKNSCCKPVDKLHDVQGGYIHINSNTLGKVRSHFFSPQLWIK